MKKLLILLLSGSSLAAQAQVEPHFSQYYVYPMWLNPALAGTSENAYRVSGLYRNQWAGISTPFSTFGVSGDFSAGNNVGLGANIMRQTAGTGGYTYTTGMLSFSWNGIRWGADARHQLGLGLQAGFLNRRFDPSKFQGGDQWQAGVGFNPTLPTTDPLTRSAAGAFDVGAGIAYVNSAADANVNPFGGISAAHLTQPQDPFIVSGEAKRLPVRLTVHGGARVRVSDNAFIVPNLLFMQQGTAREIMAGGYAQLRVNETTDFMVGANYRLEDAVSPYAGVLFGNMMIGLSYDVNTSRLGKMARGANAFELSLTLLGKRGESMDYFKCPRF
ncbi:PorP/SprF family type IX secretion system membrane protein [Flaviaesturariibacter amylovorans]|uniref:Type IX secretion system membrane protein PorP/SprF n=1 Tax=Flaviaesturariibacter amylovorans TaxID=1084520 RepID=A0ABP8HH48_9BACT